MIEIEIQLPLVSTILHEQEGESHTCRGRQEEAEIVCDNDDHDHVGGGLEDDEGKLSVALFMMTMSKKIWINISLMMIMKTMIKTGH